MILAIQRHSISRLPRGDAALYLRFSAKHDVLVIQHNLRNVLLDVAYRACWQATVIHRMIEIGIVGA